MTNLVNRDMFVDVDGEVMSMMEAHQRFGEGRFPSPKIGNCYSFAEYGNLPLIPPVGWVSDGVLPLQSKLILFGQPKVGKSFLATQMAFSIAEGLPWLGYSTHSTKVLNIQAEIAEVEFQTRLKRLPTDFAYGETIHGAKLLGTNLDLLYSRLEAVKPRVLIIDPLYMFMEGDLSNITDVTKCNTAIDQIINDFGCSVVVIHHSRKPKDESSQGMMESLGSIAIPAFYDSILWLAKVAEGINLLYFVLRNAKSPPPIMLHQGVNGLWFKLNIPREVIDGGSVSAIQQALNGRGVDIEHDAVEAYLRMEVEAGKVSRDNWGHYKAI